MRLPNETEEQYSAFVTWSAMPKRSIRRLSEQLCIPAGTLMRWSSRFAWQSRLSGKVPTSVEATPSGERKLSSANLEDLLLQMFEDFKKDRAQFPGQPVPKSLSSLFNSWLRAKKEAVAVGSDEVAPDYSILTALQLTCCSTLQQILKDGEPMADAEFLELIHHARAA